MILKVYNDFAECSKIAAVKIVDGSILALNPNDKLDH